MPRVFVRRLFIALSAFLALGVGVPFLDGQPSERRNKQEPRDSSKAEFITLEGVVNEFLFGPDAVIYGLRLGGGTRVQWPQEDTFAFTKIVNVGDRVKVSGWLQKSPTGEMSLEISTLTNMITRGTANNNQAPPAPAKDKKKTDR